MAGKRRVERLYMEADGIWVRLQREKERHMEIKVGIAYEGWNRLPRKREGYRLEGKRVYVHGHDGGSFWEGASAVWFRHWDARWVREIILGGDGGNWIRKGKDALTNALWQLDGFHLKRACYRAFGKEVGERMYDAIRSGKWEKAGKTWREAKLLEGKQAQRAYRWLGRLIQQREGQDWRHRVRHVPEGARGLGTMEGNLAHIIADRMKGKGRSWTKKGAIHMAKVCEQQLNGTLRGWCYASGVEHPHPAIANTPKPKRPKRKSSDSTAWLQARIPALHGVYPKDPVLLRLKYRLER